MKKAKFSLISFTSLFLICGNLYADPIPFIGSLTIPASATFAIPSPGPDDPVFLNNNPAVPTTAPGPPPVTVVEFGAGFPVPGTDPASSLTYEGCTDLANSCTRIPMDGLVNTSERIEFGTITYTNTLIGVAATPKTQFLKALLDISLPTGIMLKDTSDNELFNLSGTYELFVGVTVNDGIAPEFDILKIGVLPTEVPDFSNLNPLTNTGAPISLGNLSGNYFLNALETTEPEGIPSVSDKVAIGAFFSSPDGMDREFRVVDTTPKPLSFSSLTTFSLLQEPRNLTLVGLEFTRVIEGEGTIRPIPEPGTIFLFGSGLFALALLRKRKDR